MTLRLPDDKHERLRALAQSRGTSINRLLDEVTTLLLAEFDAETQFRLRVQRGAGKTTRGLDLLNKGERNLRCGGSQMPRELPVEVLRTHARRRLVV